MKTVDLPLAPLTPEAFAPYGDVIQTDGARRLIINDGTTERFHDLAGIDVGAEGGTPLVSIFRGQPRPRPIAIRMVERHPLGSQAFIPLRPAPWIVVAGPPGDRIVPEDLRAFRADGNQGVNYRRGTWHHPLLVLEPYHSFLVIDRGGDGANCDEVFFGGIAAEVVI